MPVGSEFHTEWGSTNAETTGSKGCINPRNRQQMGWCWRRVENVQGCG